MIVTPPPSAPPSREIREGETLGETITEIGNDLKWFIKSFLNWLDLLFIPERWYKETDKFV